MAVEIIMPKLGVDMSEGEIIEWKKQEGDVVNEGDILLEIMSDKTNMELEAEDSGVLLKITRQAGETVPVTEVIGYIGAEGETVETATDSPKAEAPSPAPVEPAAPRTINERPLAAKSTVNADGTVRATPAARHLAKQLEIDLASIIGSGANGRVHKEDVENYKETMMPRVSPLARKIAEDLGIDLTKVKGSGHRGKIMKDDLAEFINPKPETPTVKETLAAEKAAKVEAPEEVQEDVEVIKMSPMRKVISKRMTESYLTAPVFALNYEVDMTNLMALRKQVLEPIMNKTGNKVTFTDLIGLAVVRNLMKPEHKFLNASLNAEGTEITVHNYVNLGIAVGLDEGLLVPVVKDADKMSLSEFVTASKVVIKAAQAMKLSPAQSSGSTFSISNLGMFGIDSFNPIINQPNSAILGISATHKKPVVVDDEIVIRPIMKLTLTIDHRVVDGMNGAKFMVDLKHTLENPFELLI